MNKNKKLKMVFYCIILLQELDTYNMETVDCFLRSWSFSSRDPLVKIYSLVSELGTHFKAGYGIKIVEHASSIIGQNRTFDNRTCLFMLAFVATRINKNQKIDSVTCLPARKTAWFYIGEGYYVDDEEPVRLTFNDLAYFLKCCKIIRHLEDESIDSIPSGKNVKHCLRMWFLGTKKMPRDPVELAHEVFSAKKVHGWKPADIVTLIHPQSRRYGLHGIIFDILSRRQRNSFTSALSDGLERLRSITARAKESDDTKLVGMCENLDKFLYGLFIHEFFLVLDKKPIGEYMRIISTYDIPISMINEEFLRTHSVQYALLSKLIDNGASCFNARDLLNNIPLFFEYDAFKCDSSCLFGRSQSRKEALKRIVESKATFKGIHPYEVWFCQKHKMCDKTAPILDTAFLNLVSYSSKHEKSTWHVFEEMSELTPRPFPQIQQASRIAYVLTNGEANQKIVLPEKHDTKEKFLSVGDDFSKFIYGIHSDCMSIEDTLRIIAGDIFRDPLPDTIVLYTINGITPSMKEQLDNIRELKPDIKIVCIVTDPTECHCQGDIPVFFSIDTHTPNLVREFLK